MISRTDKRMNNSTSKKASQVERRAKMAEFNTNDHNIGKKISTIIKQKVCVS